MNAERLRIPLRAMLWLRRTIVATALSAGLAVGSVAAYCGIIIYEGNFHAVDEHVLYRSAQLSRAELRSFAQQYGLKSVLNLRGAHPGEAWYDGEVEAGRELGVAHFDYPISAKRVVTGEQIAAILDIVRHAPKPLLIHCRSGADRSGLVAALYRYAVDGAKPVEADRQLSLYYGHFPYLTSRSGAMDTSFWAYVAATAGKRSETSPTGSP
ncbi:MAG: dual specificity protein phosphatase family protein [Thiohalocapsa sp.]